MYNHENVKFKYSVNKQHIIASLCKDLGLVFMSLVTSAG